MKTLRYIWSLLEEENENHKKYGFIRMAIWKKYVLVIVLACILALLRDLKIIEF